MELKSTLMLFKIAEITKDANWNGRDSVPLPGGCAAVVISGGMDDLRYRQQVWDHGRDTGKWPPMTPFLHEAPSWVLSRVVWALLGFSGRLYPIYRVGKSALELRGFDPVKLPDTKLDLLASLKLETQEAAGSVNWPIDFLTCFSGGIALGFSEGRLKLEKKLKFATDFAPFQRVGEMIIESMNQRLEDTQSYLFTCWQENGFEWILQNTQLVVRPWGQEGMDAIILSSHMSHDDMIQQIKHKLNGEMEILEPGGDEVYAKWSGFCHGEHVEI
jgi:hypothetical protein